MKKFILFVFILLLAVISFLQSCSTNTNASEDIIHKKYLMTDSFYKSLSFDKIKTEEVTNQLGLSGKISVNEDNMIKIFPLASGHVSEVNVILGDFVKEGQVLAVIRSVDMANYYNEYNSSNSQLAVAKNKMNATENMYKSGLRSEIDFVTAQKEFQNAKSQLNKINEVLKIYGGAKHDNEVSGSTYIIKSPISGFIVEKNINTGMELRSDDATSLFTISDLKEVWAVANLYESDIAKVQPGFSAEVSTISYGDKIFFGKVDKVGNVLNLETKVLSLKIRLQNTEYILKPGMFARIILRYPENKTMLTIPKNSLVFDENKNYVIVFKNKSDVRIVRIMSYKTEGGKVYVNADLKVVDSVITNNGLFVFYALKNL